MSNSTLASNGGCPKPFLSQSLFNTSIGCKFVTVLMSIVGKARLTFTVTTGRLCTPIGSGVVCCLPCPQSDYLYPDNFNTVTTAANWVNVAALACSMFLLLSFAFLPVEKTHRHYLSICLAIGTVLMEV